MKVKTVKIVVSMIYLSPLCNLNLKIKVAVYKKYCFFNNKMPKFYAKLNVILPSFKEGFFAGSSILVSFNKTHKIN